MRILYGLLNQQGIDKVFNGAKPVNDGSGGNPTYLAIYKYMKVIIIYLIMAIATSISPQAAKAEEARPSLIHVH